ncbi:OLC1v1035298C1 [Oldenlandia corymbosa var. corymbosa]|uniref:OLC1v1035298C1 n=1 Tax=Oldenlandia corymbosa var. corymbosa TaxID=529605 RepID=A0AAV1CV70_OLDCO|nr:OLC1v1035298C1 [Oldenlandia corymbosa var. corymbosa]
MVLVLSDDIIEGEILPRLAVKTLKRFRCVSKMWRNIISDSKFTLLSAPKRQRLLLIYPRSSDSTPGVKSQYFYSIDGDLKIEKLPDPHLIIDDDDDYRYGLCFGSCDGLVSFCAEFGSGVEKLVLWNPSTGCCRTLDNLYQMVVASRYGFSLTGMCFDSPSKDYLLVVVAFPDEEDEVYVYVESLKKKEHQIGEMPEVVASDISFPYDFPQGSGSGVSIGVLLNGHLHWIVERKGDQSRLIVYFEHEVSRFGELSLPQLEESDDDDDDDGVPGNFFGLCVLHDCLCVVNGVEDLMDDYHCDVFMMRDYGNQESWGILFSVRGLIMPLNIGVPDKVLVFSSKFGKLYTYDLETDVMMEIDCPPSGLLPKFVGGGKEIPLCMEMRRDPLLYLESLASVHSQHWI